MGRATLRTVAEEAGVSVTTVSNAFNRPDQLSPALRERILGTAARLGYAGPDATARSLRSGRAGAIGVLFSETLSYVLSDPFAAEYLRGLASVAERHGTGLLLIPADDLDPESASIAVQRAVVDGFVLECVHEPSPVLDAVLARGVPLVSATAIAGRSVPQVGIDDRAAAAQAAGHLAQLGHRRVSIVVDARPPSTISGVVPIAEAMSQAEDRDVASRIAGFAAGLSDADLEVIGAERNLRDSGRLAAAALLDRRDRPTAILATSDVLAAGVLDALAERGLRPGREVSVVGFDDVELAADLGITSIRQPIHEKGRLAALRLLDPDRALPDPVLLPTELIVRASTGPAPREGD